jgi:hypothetical protein
MKRLIFAAALISVTALSACGREHVTTNYVEVVPPPEQVTVYHY